MIRSLIAFAAGVLLTLGVVAAQRFTREVPDSPLASPAASAAARAVRETMAPHIASLLTGGIEKKRAILDEHFYGPKIEEARRLYPVRESAGEIAGVYVETFEPIGGPSPGNERRVLINLHGGAFEVGARTEGRLESIPVAHVAGMRVVSVDYRQGPEHRFPAASEDVAAVYRALLADHAPGQIGIFGCSAGGMLTAQSLAWFDAHDLPQPGAAGIFCAGAGEFGAGDARVIGAAFGASGGGSEIAYLADVDWRDPLVAPIHHPKLLERFPPTLVITSTRDGALSSAAATHQRLRAAGTTAELHVFEGLPHYFFADTGLPESREVFARTAEFFDRHLAR